MSVLWKMVGASVKGTSHDKSGAPCQDSHGAAQAAGFFLGAVADGAGSVSHAERGSQLAVEAALAHLSGALTAAAGTMTADTFKAMFLDAINAARARLQAEAAAQSLALSAFSTTLILFAAFANGVAACQVGDGALVVLTADDAVIAVTRPPIGEYVNETTFITSEAWEAAAQHAFLPGKVRRAAAFSDGLQQLALKFPDCEPFAPFFRPLFALVDEAVDPARATDQLTQFLDSPRINERTDDDKTLLLAGLN